MFRAALLSIVLTLAAGPHAVLLCGTWCHAGTEMAGACERHRQTTTPPVVAADECAVNGNPVMFVREDSRRSAPAPDVAGAVAIARFAFPRPATSGVSAYEPDSQLLLELRPLILALRI